jgi:putative heme-binding domain-containing protein
LLEHPSEHLRSWTIRLLGDRRQLPGGIGEKLVDLARREPSVTVRSQLACTCKRLSATAALPIIEQLCQRAEDVDDPHIPLLLWWAIEDKAITDRALVLERFGTKAAWNQPLTRGVIVERLVRRYLAEGQPADYLACARMLADAPQASDRERLVQALEQQMAGRSFEQAPSELSGPLTTLLATSEPSSALVRLGLRMGLDSAAPVAVARAADARLPAAERVEFIRALRDLKPQGSLAALLTLLESDPSAQIQDAALQALQGFDDPAVPNTILARYEALTPALRDRARDILTSRPNWSAQLLVEVEAAKIAAKDFSIEQVRRIVLHELPELNQRVEKLWGQVQPKTSREKEGRITAVGRILGKGPGDAAKGKPLFVKHCANCHQLFGEGLKVGPDLSGVDRKNLGILLHNVFDPSAILREGYQQYVVSTVDGLVLTGLLAESTPESVTILDAKNVRTVIPRGKVDEMKASAASLMPEGILDTASEQELRDLFQYLRSDPEQPAAPK